MDEYYRLRTIDTKLPVRAMKVTICDMCHEATAIMFDVLTNTLVAQPAFWTPLVDQGLSERCESCRQAVNKRIMAERWLLQPDFFKTEFGLKTIDAEEIKRKYLSHWPAAPAYTYIEKAALLIWYDNGMINRQEPEAEKLDLLRRWLKKLDQDKLADIDQKLSWLTDDQLDIVCCGDEFEAEKLTYPHVHEFLGKIFDEEYLNGST